MDRLSRATLSLIFLSAGACVTPENSDTSEVLKIGASSERREMTGLEDMSFEYIKAQWGEPDAEEIKAEGRTVRYKNVKSQDLDAVEGDSNVKSCLLRLELNKEQLVTAWEYENCRSDE